MSDPKFDIFMRRRQEGEFPPIAVEICATEKIQAANEALVAAALAASSKLKGDFLVDATEIKA